MDLKIKRKTDTFIAKLSSDEILVLDDALKRAINDQDRDTKLNDTNHIIAKDIAVKIKDTWAKAWE